MVVNNNNCDDDDDDTDNYQDDDDETNNQEDDDDGEYKIKSILCDNSDESIYESDFSRKIKLSTFNNVRQCQTSYLIFSQH